MIVTTIVQTKKGKGSNTIMSHEYNAMDANQLFLLLGDLELCGLPINKAIKKFILKKSDWDASLGM